MIRLTAICCAIVALIVFACPQETQAKKKMSDKEVEKWFDKGKWREGFAAIPDKSVNKRTFAEHYAAHPETWEKVFKFLAETDLVNHPVGRVDLGSDAYVSFAVAETKDISAATFETHKKVIDLQYIAAGCEMMSVVPATQMAVKVPYNPARDVELYEPVNAPLLPAGAGNFFLFFPDEAHRPSVNCGEPAKVTKVVVKISVE